MVLEHFLDSSNVKKHSFFIFVLSFFYVLVGFVASVLFFGSSVSVAMLFTLTLLLSPSLAHILSREERIERREGLHHFYHNHKDVFKVYLFSFLGLFLGFVVLSYFGDFDSIFRYQIGFLESQRGLSQELLVNFKDAYLGPSIVNVFSLFSDNLFVVLVCFTLSIFYGAGAIFLIVLNSSIFAAFLRTVYSYAAESGLSFVSLFSITMLYFIPEILGFILAAIAGGILSTALYRENFRSQRFRNVLQNCLVLLLISIGVIFLAAILEVFIGQVMLHRII